MTVKATPSNVYVLDQSKPIRDIAFEFGDWLRGGRHFPDPETAFGGKLRVALIHPATEAWIMRQVDEYYRFGATFNAPSLLHEIAPVPLVRDRTLPEGVIQVLTEVELRA